MNLQFTNINFDQAVEKIEPQTFHPDVKEYVIYPKLGSPFITFWVTMNQDPAPGDSTDFYYKPFPDFDLFYKKNWETSRYRWLPSSRANPQEHANYITVEDRGSRIEIICEAHGKGLESHSVLLSVKTPIGQCPHDNTHAVPGDVFGGASGSCQIETLIYCKDCGKLVEKQYEYCD